MSKKKVGVLQSVYGAQASKDGTLPPLPEGSSLADFDGVMDGQWITADFWTLDLGATTLLQPVSQLGLLWAQEQFGFRRSLHARSGDGYGNQHRYQHARFVNVSAGR